MPLKLIQPRAGKSKNYSIRGTYMHVYVDRSAGTSVEATAKKLLAKWKRDIESGAYATDDGPTFLSAALTYVKAGGDPRFVGSFDQETKQWSGLIGHFGEMSLAKIDQAAIDEAAHALYPGGTAATKNRQVHAVVSVILKRAGVSWIIHRPKGSAGNKRTTWLTKEQAFALFRACDGRDAEFGAFVRTILYTGMRLSEAIGMQIKFLELPDSFAYVPTTKNGDPRGVHLPPVIVATLANHPRGLDRPEETVFRFRKCGRLYTWLSEALDKAGIALPARTGFHVLRHTWATWMRRYGGLDTRGLVGTGAWADEASAARYEHVVASEEAKRADLLPVENARISDAENAESWNNRGQKTKALK